MRDRPRRVGRPAGLPRVRLTAAAAVLGLITAGCASERTPEAEPAPAATDASPSASASPTATTTATATATPSPAEGMANACPEEGCGVRIVGVRAEGGELVLDLEANYAPDISHNHFHIYWDRFTARQVSDDAAPRFGVAQGDWVPTDQNPFTTTDAVSLAKRENSGQICVTTGNRDHNVVDPERAACHDVSGAL